MDSSEPHHDVTVISGCHLVMETRLSFSLIYNDLASCHWVFSTYAGTLWGLCSVEESLVLGCILFYWSFKFTWKIYMCSICTYVWTFRQYYHRGNNCVAALKFFFQVFFNVCIQLFNGLEAQHNCIIKNLLYLVCEAGRSVESIQGEAVSNMMMPIVLKSYIWLTTGISSHI